MIKNKNFPSCNSFFAEEEIPVCEITDYNECASVYENIVENSRSSIISSTLYDFLQKKIGTRFQQFNIHINNENFQNTYIYCVSIPWYEKNISFFVYFANVYVIWEMNTLNKFIGKSIAD